MMSKYNLNAFALAGSATVTEENPLMRIFFCSTLSQVLLLLSVLNFPANGSQIWEGTGRVINGLGRGGSVKLRLEIDGEIVRSLSGPSLYGKIKTTPKLNGTIQTKSATWHLEQCGEDLCVNLQQHNLKQIVFYRLQPRIYEEKIKPTQ